MIAKSTSIAVILFLATSVLGQDGFTTLQPSHGFFQTQPIPQINPGWAVGRFPAALDWNLKTQVMLPSNLAAFEEAVRQEQANLRPGQYKDFSVRVELDRAGNPRRFYTLQERGVRMWQAPTFSAGEIRVESTRWRFLSPNELRPQLQNPAGFQPGFPNQGFSAGPPVLRNSFGIDYTLPGLPPSSPHSAKTSSAKQFLPSLDVLPRNHPPKYSLGVDTRLPKLPGLPSAEKKLPK